MIDFECNICGQLTQSSDSEYHREMLACKKCGGSARFRGVALAFQKFVLGSAVLPLSLAPEQKEIRGIGMSDAGYASEIERICDFTNTFYHKEPHLDVTDFASSSRFQDLDFVLSSEVLEHIKAPVSVALANIYAMLKPGGVLILTVPYLEGYETIEHFPHLHMFEIIKVGENFTMSNIRPDGAIEHHDNLVFHGGPGSVLEMRIFGEGDLMAMLTTIGFAVHVLPFDERCGYHWPEVSESELWRGRKAKSHVLICRRPAGLHA